MTEAEPSNLAWLSRLMAWLATIGAVVSPLLDAVIYIWPGQVATMDADHLGGLLNAGVPLPWRLAALAFSLGGELFTVWALWSLRSLFLLYAQGEVFSARALRLVNTVAIALFAGVIVSFVLRAPITALLSWTTVSRSVSFEFGSSDVVMLFSAGVVLVIARVMIEARRLADENAKFV